MTTPIRKTNNVVQENSHVKFVKRGTTCDEGAMIVASSSKQDNFKASSDFKTQESSSHVSFYADFVLTRNHIGKVIARFVGPRTLNTKVERHVWVPKVLVTSTQALSIVGYLKEKSNLVLQGNSSGGSTWVIDTGCTNHMTEERSMFDTLTKSSGDHYITFAGNEKEKVLGTGNITLNSKFSLSTVLLIEPLCYNLLSIS